MLLIFTNGDTFAAGALRYSYIPIPRRDDATPRIIVEMEIEGELEPAVLDTGAPYLVCSPDLAERLSLDPDDALESGFIKIQGEKVEGRMYRANCRLTPNEGTGLDFQATAFVPNPEQSITPNLLTISFLGMYSCLERIRFAVDPSSETLYFGQHP